jgi:hypothetical protein
MKVYTKNGVLNCAVCDLCGSAFSPGSGTTIDGLGPDQSNDKHVAIDCPTNGIGISKNVCESCADHINFNGKTEWLFSFVYRRIRGLILRDEIKLFKYGDYDKVKSYYLRAIDEVGFKPDVITLYKFDNDENGIHQAIYLNSDGSIDVSVDEESKKKGWDRASAIRIFKDFAKEILSGDAGISVKVSSTEDLVAHKFFDDDYSNRSITVLARFFDMVINDVIHSTLDSIKEYKGCSFN